MTREDPRAWDEFVSGALNGTLFHTQRFLGYHPEGRFSWDHLVLRDGSETRAVFPAAAADGGETWFSGAGASYGGPVVGADASPEECRDVVITIAEEAARRGYRRVRLTPPPVIYERGAKGLVRAALEAEGFRCTSGDVSHSAPLAGKAPIDLLAAKARRGAGKAEREGVSVRESSEYAAFHDLLVADRGAKGLLPTHSHDELVDLGSRLGSAQTLLLARWGGELVAGAWLLQLNERVGLSFYVCQSWEHRRLRATNLLMFRALEWAAQRGLDELDYGTSSVRGELNQGLADFKAAHGGIAFDRETFVREFP